MLGVSVRTVQSMTSRGLIPGAAKIGGTFTYDVGKLRRFIAVEEAKCLRTISTKEMASGGCEPRSGAVNIERAYERAMSKARGGSGTPALRKFDPPVGAARGGAHGVRQ
jgi:hypothetical protein